MATYPQCSCLENPTDKGAWWVTVHRVTKSQPQLKQLSTQKNPKNQDSHTFVQYFEKSKSMQKFMVNKISTF